MEKKKAHSKKSKEQQAWEVLVDDFKTQQSLQSEFEGFETISKDQFKEKIMDSMLKSGRNLSDTLDELIKLKDYLSPRSGRCLHFLNECIDKEFKNIRITLPEPFVEANWQKLETMSEEDLNKKELHLNGIPFTTHSLVDSLNKLFTFLNVKIENAEVFPFDVDSYGLPPYNCRRILTPLVWMRTQIESDIRKHCQPTGCPINQIVFTLQNAPKNGHLKKLAIPSFFLEKAADNLNYKDYKEEQSAEFFEKLKQQFGSLKIDELTMVLPDMLLAYSEELLEGVLPVCYFIPFELLRLMFLCWRPEVVNLRLRTEACSSFEDASRIEWDDEEVFTSTTLYNDPLFDRCGTMSLGEEKEIQECKLIVEATGSRLFDPIHNEKNANTAGRDFLVLFPMSTILINRTVTLKSGCSMITQLKQQFEFIINTFFWNAEQHRDRVVNYQLTLLNVGPLEVAAVRKHLPKKANGRKIGVTFEVEPETVRLFKDFGSSSSLKRRETFASFFDAENSFIVDLKVVLSN